MNRTAPPEQNSPRQSWRPRFGLKSFCFGVLLLAGISGWLSQQYVGFLVEQKFMNELVTEHPELGSLSWTKELPPSKSPLRT